MTPEQKRAIALANARRRMSEDGPDFAAQAQSMDPTDLSVARSKNDAFGEYLRNEALKPVEGEGESARYERLYGKISTPRPGTGEGMLRAAVQGGTFGAGDEIVGAGTAALDSLVNGENFGDAYDVRVANERSKIKNFREDNPVAAYGTEMVGAIPTAIMTAPQQAVTTGGRVLLNGLTGLYQGGIYGFNSGEGGVKERAKDAVLPATAGAGLGMMSVPASAAVGKLANRLMTSKVAKKIGMSPRSYEILSDMAGADEVYTGTGAQRLAEIGPDAMLADSGVGMNQLLDSAANMSGPGARLAGHRINQRMSGASQRLTSTLDDILGEPQGVRQASRGIAQGTSAARSDAYKAAYAQPINYADDAGRNIEDVLSRIPDRIKNEAIQDANDMMVAAGERNNQIKITVADDGALSFSEMPNVQQLDYIKRALGNMKEAAKGDFGKATGKSNMLGDLAKALKGAVSDAVPGYSDAVRLGGDKIQRDNALRLGREMLSPSVTREVVGEVADDLSDEARQAAFQGLRGSIDDALANVKRTMTDPNVDAREATKLIKDLSSRANRDKVKMLLGDDLAGQLFKELDQSSAAFDLRAAVAQNSKTEPRKIINERLGEKLDGGAIQAFRDADPVQSVRSLAQTLMGGGPNARRKLSDKVVLELADLLTQPNPQQVLQRLQQAPGQIDMKNAQVRSLVENLLRRNVPVTAPTVQGMR